MGNSKALRILNICTFKLPSGGTSGILGENMGNNTDQGFCHRCTSDLPTAFVEFVVVIVEFDAIVFAVVVVVVGM